jgi:hypothetical protein
MPMTVTAHGYRFEVLTAGHLPTAPGQIEPAIHALRGALHDMGAPRVSLLHASDKSASAQGRDARRPAELSALEAHARQALRGADTPLVLVSAA